MADDFWRSNVCCIVTGATRGFGKAVCIAFAKRFLEVHSNSSGEADTTKKISFVLLGRNRSLLDELQSTLDKLSPNVHVIEVIAGPLEDSKTVRTFENALQTFGQVGPKYEHAILVHNAGQLGDPNRLVGSYSSEDSEYLSNYMESNFSSLVKLTGAFLRAFSTSAQRTVLNISSLLALEPYQGLALYGAVKAARDSYLRSVALEEQNINALNYAPGIMDTDMASELKNEGFNQTMFKDPKNVLQPLASAQKLITILEQKKYKNGQHVDYYDFK